MDLADRSNKGIKIDAVMDIEKDIQVGHVVFTAPYLKKGMGFAKNPKKSIKNSIYHKTTFSFWDLFK